MTGGRLACAVIYDREFTPEEVRRFLVLTSDPAAAPAHFRLEGRVVRYECSSADEARWRLALEILVVKSHRQSSPPRRTDARTRLGLPPIPR